jgi:hypothetical protein
MKRFIILAGMLVLAGEVFAGGWSGKPVSIVHASVLKDFVLRYDDVSSGRWFPDRKGSTMYFIMDGYNDKAVYDANGRWKYSLIFYGESKLPRDIRAVVKRQYFDFDIKVVEEVQVLEGKAYFVHLEDKTTFKLVKVTSEGEMETIEDFRKS